MSARLQRHVHRGPSRIPTPLAAISQSRPLSMQPTQLSMKPLPDRRPVTGDHSSNQRVRTDPPAPTLSKLQSPQQVLVIPGS